MATQYFDDGSTLTIDDATGAVSSTDAPDYNLPSAVWSPGSVNPAASTWDQVLQYGVSRIIDAKVRPVRPENTAPLLQRQVSYLPGSGGFADLLPWLLIGGVALLVITKFAK